MKDQCDLCGAWLPEDLLAPIWDGEGSACADQTGCAERCAAEAAAEAESLAFAESGGGQEMINDLRFHQCYPDE